MRRPTRKEEWEQPETKEDAKEERGETRSVEKEDEAEEAEGDKKLKMSQPQGVKRKQPEEEETVVLPEANVPMEPQFETETVKLMRLSAQECGVDVAEIYSPPRVTAEAKYYGLRVGEAVDITGWDFRDAKQRNRAWKYLEEMKPALLIGSPMCTMFSTLQNMSPNTEEKMRKW